ncbi:two-component system sensor histidine kinase NtrB [Pelodictyon phaeoclathratiforme]|uniref:histidine kinase n=1 Tax=Pelodictyon phaeoclathratiforme (strain DSM 5477 / BU-1) TaxID=324925 RepID=B4SH96_PELPB|nr:PAS domain-containing hybrid sensor histidine kinase/response regulator [Pelodictyon phaeoclathratiforme]ACF43563.1 PAS/PAC sensor signal transduction histidine kinase [Pelodictyon phaeoclathratiforme BU-1]MBV5289139.1 PAS domain S-box protein [Pelodictyon phaeoclathratiforme]
MKKSQATVTDISELRCRAEDHLRKSQPGEQGFSLSQGDMHRMIHELSVHQIELQMQQEELLQSKDELEDALARYTRLYDFAPVGYLTLAVDGTILDANLTATTMFGVDRSLLKGSCMALFVAPEEMRVFKALMERVFSHQAQGSCDLTLCYESLSATLRCTVHIDAVIQDDGQSCCMALSDVTRQKRIEREHAAIQITLVQAQKMESIGRLAGGVAHDMNNMLQVQLGNIEYLLSMGELSESVRLTLSDLQNSVMRSAGIVRQLLAFARKQIIHPKVLDFNAAITTILRMLGHILGEHIKLIFAPGTLLWSVKIDAVQIDQIMTNLALNARDAIKVNGTLFIVTRNVVVEADFCHDHSELIPGDYVLLEVRDDGFGMEKEVLDYVFEPYFTTKFMGDGAGLGLAMVYGIVQQNHGAIFASSIKGTGTTFAIYLPRVPACPQI